MAKKSKTKTKKAPPPPSPPSTSGASSSESDSDSDGASEDENEISTSGSTEQEVTNEPPTKKMRADNDVAELKQTDGSKPNFYGSDSFSSLPLSPQTTTALATLNFTKMTQIQQKSIPALLTGKDLVGAAKTGSGKVGRGAKDGRLERSDSSSIKVRNYALLPYTTTAQ